MHWALVAHKDQKDINLSSLRMLLVADGSNPCKVTPSLHSGALSLTWGVERGMFEIENVREMDKLSWEVRKLGHFTGIEQDVSVAAHLVQ